MISTFIKVILLLFIPVLFASCAHRMVGTWTVERYETTTPGDQGTVLKNIGTMKFFKDGTGQKDLNYSILGIKHNEQATFNWTWNDGKYISIEGDNSDFSKSWIIMENRRKYQRWKSTNGANRVQIVELSK